VKPLDYCFRRVGRLGDSGMRSSTDVLVVGAGPVGLLLACELQRQGIDYLLVERTLERSYFCKALGVTPRTLELFEALGVVGEAIDCGIWLAGWTSFENGVQTGSQDHRIEGFPYGFLAIPQYETERILESCLYRHGGVVSRGLTLTGFTDGTDGVRARIEEADGATHPVQCRWLVGCDGARSAVRRGLGLEFEGNRYPMNFMLGDVELEWNQPRGRAYRFHQTVEGQLRNAMVAVPVRGSARRYRLSMGSPQPATEELLQGLGSEVSRRPALEELTAIAAPMLPPGTGLSHLRWSSNYSVSHRIVPRYSVSHVFLAGDAAHIHPPIGGLGMNTGLQDAHNLSWKLALAKRGTAGAALLDSYSAERHPVGLDVVNETSRAMDEAVSGGWRPRSAEGRESQLFIHYRSSALVRDDFPADQENLAAPRAGDRAPDALGLGRPFVARRFRLRERLELGYHVLIGYTVRNQTESHQKAFADLLEMLRRRLDASGAGLTIVAPDAGFVDCELMPLFVDHDGSFQQVYAATPGMIWLVRPDGHIAWRCDRPDMERLALFIDRIVPPQT
jgi:2-polyprenyl-6-methoxyphenol hydroxylase-like FAD-dependent oxidoreductase